MSMKTNYTFQHPTERTRKSNSAAANAPKVVSRVSNTAKEILCFLVALTLPVSEPTTAIDGSRATAHRIVGARAIARAQSLRVRSPCPFASSNERAISTGLSATWLSKKLEGCSTVEGCRADDYGKLRRLKPGPRRALDARPMGDHAIYHAARWATMHRW